MNLKNIKVLLTRSVFACLIIMLNGCVIHMGKASLGYDLKGVRIPSDCKTACVLYLQNHAALVQPMLSRDITEKLRDKILSQTPLKLVNANGDVNFEGAIESYSTQPMAVQAGSTATAALNRLSITIQVKYVNSKDSQWDYDTKFTRYIDYSSEKNLSDVEGSDEYTAMLVLLVQDIFDKAFVNW
jgi:hypothetical protein